MKGVATEEPVPTWMEELSDEVYKEAMKNTIKSMRHVLRRDKIMKIYDLHLQTSK